MGIGLPASCSSLPLGPDGQLHFLLPEALALRSGSRLGLPSSVEEVVSRAWLQRAISLCSEMDVDKAVSQVFISSCREKGRWGPQGWAGPLSPIPPHPHWQQGPYLVLGL